MSYDELINELAELVGIVSEYWDIFGNKHVTSLETKKLLLRACGVNVDSIDEIKKVIEDIKARPWNRLTESVHVISINNQPIKIPLYIHINDEPIDLKISWTITDENGNVTERTLSYEEISISEERWINEKRYIKLELYDDKERDIGYYTVSIRCSASGIKLEGKSKIIVTPDFCYMPKRLEDWRTWGLSINLYSIRSKGNYGIGDLGDLKKIMKGVSDLKGGFVGINPLHSIPNKRPFGISPYSPISRLYKNFVYIDLEEIPDVKGLINQDAGLEKEIKRLRDSQFIDYEGVMKLKKSLLEKAFDIFYEEHYLKKTKYYEDFAHYLSEEGPLLESFATYMSLAEDFAKGEDDYLFNWREWEGFKYSSENKIQEYKRLNHKRVLFYCYLQWLIDKQIKELYKLADELKMSIGIYHDLAIGSISGSFDIWMNQELFAFDVDIGAPPDDFNPDGQNWGFPPIIPERLRESGYEFFIEIIRKNMRYFGAIRIDHALGMFRQFWIPKGMPASCGAYVKQPTEELLRIIALESVKNNTLVIAEDLGTVGENVSETLNRFRMFSYKLLYFQRDYPDPSFLLPDRYPELALCAVTTHDLPTINGWWIGRDIEVKERLNLYKDRNSITRDIQNRERDKELLIKALKETSLLDPCFIKPSYMSSDLRLAIYEYLSKTPCKLLSVSLDDIVGSLDQQNMPGICDDYPSWMQKIPSDIEEIMSDEIFLRLCQYFCRNNRFDNYDIVTNYK
jgi:4-alpha-glucanotransferase